MGEGEILLEMRGQTALLTLNRPERRNALTTTMLVSIARNLEGLWTEGEARCVVLRGAGDKAFCAGMDLTSLPTGMPEELLSRIESKGPLQFAAEAIEGCPLPVIAMIRGYALGGGCELAMACDLRVGAEGCRMGMPPARLGIVYPPEGLSRFIRVLGPAASKKVFLTARYLEAREACETGLLQYLVPDDELEEFTMELAREVASRAPLALAGIKRSLHILSRHASPSEEEAAEMQDLIARALSSEDAVEAITAFREKREPRFEGR